MFLINKLTLKGCLGKGKDFVPSTSQGPLRIYLLCKRETVDFRSGGRQNGQGPESLFKPAINKLSKELAKQKVRSPGKEARHHISSIMFLDCFLIGLRQLGGAEDGMLDIESRRLEANSCLIH